MIDKLIKALQLDPTIRAVTRVIDAKNVVRVSRRVYKKCRVRKSRGEFTVTIGAPNYLTVAFIKQCKEDKQALSGAIHVQYLKKRK